MFVHTTYLNLVTLVLQQH